MQYVTKTLCTASCDVSTSCEHKSITMFCKKNSQSLRKKWKKFSFKYFFIILKSSMKLDRVK